MVIEPLSTGLTAPTPGEIDKLFALLTTQLNFTESPLTGTLAGSAVKETILGRLP